MSIRHNNNQEIRYIKHQNLKEEARIIANYYRDLIHSYGMDCVYYKSSVDLPPEFTKVITSNNIMKRAYGYDPDISFNLSANLITYTEVDEDIFVLDRIGIKNDQKISFYFDATEFATAFMTSLGQFKEYPIIPINDEITGIVDPDGKLYFEEDFTSDVLSGTIVCNTIAELYCGTADASENTKHVKLGIADPTLSADAGHPILTTVFDGSYSGAYDIWQDDSLSATPELQYKEGFVPCIIKSHSKPVFKLPVNEFIARSFSYEASDGEVSIVAYFRYKLYKDGTFTGKLQGTVLYYDLNLVANYVQKIKPNVGDIIILDTSWGNIVYEVNEVKDQGITQNDNLNPLVYKYIFKIAAQKRINSYEDTAPIEDSIQEKLDNITKENISNTLFVNEISKYEDNEDMVYGGFTGKEYIKDNYVDTRNESIIWDESKIYSGTIMNVLTFGNGNSLLTDGYDLYYKNVEERVTKLTLSKQVKPKNYNGINSSLRYIKANKGNIYFQNIDGIITKLIGNADMTIDPNFVLKMENITNDKFNEDGMNFYKFKNCKTLLFSTPYNLFCRLEKDSKFHLLA